MWDRIQLLMDHNDDMDEDEQKMWNVSDQIRSYTVVQKEIYYVALRPEAIRTRNHAT